jgi:hypothetical protein
MQCSLCLGANLEIENLNKKINNAKDIVVKAEFAQDLLVIVDSLIEQHKDKMLPCVGVLNLRKRTATLIIKTKKLV